MGDSPPVCGICDRKVRAVYIKAIGPTKEYPYCKDCFFGWYDGADKNTKKGIKKYVHKKHGKHGSEADLKQKEKADD